MYHQVVHSNVKCRTGTYNWCFTCNLSNGLELHGGEGMAEGSLGVFEVVRVDVAHPDVFWLPVLLPQGRGQGVDVNQEGLKCLSR